MATKVVGTQGETVRGLTIPKIHWMFPFQRSSCILFFFQDHSLNDGTGSLQSEEDWFDDMSIEWVDDHFGLSLT